MNCINCKFFSLLEGDEALGSGTCHRSPGQLFLIDGAVKTHHPEALSDDPACEGFQQLEFSGFRFGQRPDFPIDEDLIHNIKK